MTTDGRKTVGLALGAGAARGCAHFGVLDALREERIPIDYVSGTSIGSLIGGTLAAGKVDELRDAVVSMDWKEIIYHFFEVSIPRSGLIDGRRITEFIGQFIADRTIESLDIPFQAAAADIITGNEVVLDTGPLMEAIRASISMPGVFTPVVRGEQVLVDGGVVNPVPVNLVQNMGADLVIAVDINHDRVGSRKRETEQVIAKAPTSFAEWQEQFREAFSKRTVKDIAVAAQIKKWSKSSDVPNIFDVLGNTIRIMEAQIGAIMLEVTQPQVVVQPDVGYISFMEFNRAEEAIELGYRATKAALAASDIDWPRERSAEAEGSGASNA